MRVEGKMSGESLEEQGLPKVPDLELARLYFQATCLAFSAEERDQARKIVMETVREKSEGNRRFFTSFLTTCSRLCTLLRINLLGMEDRRGRDASFGDESRKQKPVGKTRRSHPGRRGKFRRDRSERRAHRQSRILL